MSACEWCWEEASRQAYHNGASVAEMYRLIIHEQNMLGLNALCPQARANHENVGKSDQSRNK